MVNHDRCEPPPGTAPGTVCVLERLRARRHRPAWAPLPNPAKVGEVAEWTWAEHSEWRRPYVMMNPKRAAELGWRFVRVAEE